MTTVGRATTAHVRIDHALEQLRAGLHESVCEMEQLRAELDDLRKANHAYAQALASVRGALGAIEDADLVEAARSLAAESAGRRKALEQVGEERRAEWTRAERAEAERDRALAAIRAYKAAVDGPDGVADAEAAMFAVLKELDHAQP